jgi:tetratricopeptide (TPR) repeat protein
MARNFDGATSTAGLNPLAGIGEAEKQVLSYSALMGKEFDFSVLCAATEIDDLALAELLEKLVHKGILRELKDGDSYAFVRTATFVQAYRDVPSSGLRGIHKRIARAYEKLHPEPTPGIIPEMGRHFYLGGIHHKSLIYNRYAARLAMNAFSPDVAIRYLERVREDLLALSGDHRVEEAEVLKEIGDHYAEMGHDELADKAFGESLKKLPEDKTALRALITLARGEAFREMNKIGLARQYCDEAIRLMEIVGHKKGLALAHLSLARSAYELGEYELGIREIETSIRFFDPEKDAKDLAYAYVVYGNMFAAMVGPVPQAKATEYYRKAIQILEPLRDIRELGRIHNNLAIAMGFTRPREALQELMEARDCAQRGKDNRFLGWVYFNTVELHLALGQEMEAAQNNAEARRILSNFNDPIGLQQITLNDGIIAQHRKAYAESERAYLDSLQQEEKLGYTGDLVEVLLHLALLYGDWGRKQDATGVVYRIEKIGASYIHPTNRAIYEDLKRRLGI